MTVHTTPARIVPVSDPPAQKLPLNVPIVLYAETWGMGGTALYVVNLAKGLRQLGYEVAVICGAKGIPGDGIGPMRSMLGQIGVDVQAIEDHDSSLRGILRRVRSFSQIIRKYRDCVLVALLGEFQTGGTIALTAAIARAPAFIRVDLQPPVVASVPITKRHRFDAWWQNFVIDRYVVGCAENVVDFARFLGRPAAKTEVIHTGTELERFVPDHNREPTRRVLGYSPEAMVIGTVSRIAEERKGMTFFAEMAGLLAPRFPQARFLIVGDGPTRAALERQIAALGIAERVHITGWRTDIPDLLAAMDIFVMPALVEGGPTTVLEAMAMAKPTVSTRVGMVPEVMEHRRTGLIVEPGSAQALADAVATLLTDEPLRRRVGEHARKVAEARFSVETMVERYLDLFSRVRCKK